MSDLEKFFHQVAGVVCGKSPDESAVACYQKRDGSVSFCRSYDKCRIAEMTVEQLTYVLHPLDQKSYLKACPGSGKTEAVALKAAYALRAQPWKHTGIAFLSFTNHAVNVIQERVARSTGRIYPHYIGTFNGWLHGYILNPFGWRVMKYDGKNGDKSVRIVEASSDAAFLNGFKTKYKYAKTGNVGAHEYFLEENRIVFDSGNDGTDAARNAVALADWQVNDLMDAKARFWKAGFANHQDVETICHLVLHDLSFVRTQIANRFPYLIIDECQDLCPSQLQLLTELRQAGANIHLVGDLNQSIFSFRGSDPSVLLKHIADEKLAALEFTVNFRSVQPVVEVCGRLIDHGSIQGRALISKEASCVYFSYQNKNDLPQLVVTFHSWLKQRGFKPSDCAVITRGSSTLEKLRGGQADDPRGPAHRIAAAIRDWKKGGIVNRQSALAQFGSVVASSYFSGESSDSSAYHCPHVVASNIEWRLFLAAVLDACIAQSKLTDFNQTWTSWAEAARQLVPTSVIGLWKSLPALGTAASVIRAPHGKATDQVAATLGLNAAPAPLLHFTNIHQVKGETFDAVLFVSSPTKAGDGGHWSHWLDPAPAHAEHRRFAYVASSRPRHVLAWAVPAPSTAEQAQLTQLGFVPA